jgi:hypothetical protein
MKIIVLFIIVIQLTNFSLAQHHEISDKAIMWKGKQFLAKDTNSILYALKTGDTHGHFRYFFSNTVNDGLLTDYYANAIGGGIRYESNKYKKLQFAVSGFYFFDLGSSNLAQLDSSSNQPNRYEIGLFDVENPNNHSDMDRLEELYLKYNFKNTHLIIGRQLINTPMINLQDGRMRGTGVEGIWIESNQFKNISFSGGWLTGVSPRSTTKWYTVAESIGVYQQGITTIGTKSNYKNNLTSLGVGVVGIKFSISEKLKGQIWNYYVDNIINSIFTQFNYTKSFQKSRKLVLAGQLIHQSALNNGGNDDATLTYVTKNNQSLTFGAKLALIGKKIDLSLNYNRITEKGRYLFPREWGRDPFFTFMPRERNEGFGDLHAVMVKIEYKELVKNLNTTFSVGYFSLPDVTNFELNKYGMPSYFQANIDVRYNLNKLIEGLEAQLLIVAKLNNGSTYNNPKFEHNKVNMLLTNVVLNYHF